MAEYLPRWHPIIRTGGDNSKLFALELRSRRSVLRQRAACHPSWHSSTGSQLISWHIVATKAARLGISLGNPNPNPRECLDYAKSIVLEPRRHVRAPLLCPLRGEGER